ncbi:hypothetical protein ACN28S_25990 [Cystobacter fuscus]
MERIKGMNRTWAGATMGNAQGWMLHQASGSTPENVRAPRLFLAPWLAHDLKLTLIIDFK